MLVGTETIAAQISVGRHDVHRHMGVKFMFLVVPIQLFTGIGHPVCQIAHPNATAQFPEALIVPIGGVGRDVEVDIEPIVVALEQNALAKFLTWRVSAVEDQPLFRNNLVANNARVADEFRHPIGDHHRQRIAIAHRRSARRRAVVAG